MKSSSLFASIILQGLFVTPKAARPKQALPGTPWEDLRNVLSSPDILTVPSVFDWKEQCLDPMVFTEPFVTDPLDPFKLYGYDIGFKPAGVCMVHMSCMYPSCFSPLPNPYLLPCPPDTTCVEPNRALSPPFDDSNLFDDEMELPAAVLQPKTASDVVRGIEFAVEHDIGISVKVIGHSYFGASTSRGTLLIKMSTNFPGYAEEGSLTECAGYGSNSTSDAMSMACAVATAREKKAVLRVGGGELFDTAYRAVFFDWNGNPSNANHYHFVGGFCGTVSAAGGWLHSGGLSGSSMRLHGVGVDQVLHIEMVLPNGTHVRFGPTSWEEEEGSLYHKTTEVTGYCNAKPYETDESMWEWTTCEGEEENINFEDLWFAVRGGGGGTFGILTSVYYQLHDLPGNVTEVRAYDPGFERADVEKTLTVASDYLNFSLRYLFLPETLHNVSDVESNSCNAPAPAFTTFPLYSALYCQNSAGYKIVDEWKKYLETSQLREKYGDDEAFMTSMESLFFVAAEYPNQGYVTLLTEGPYAGRLNDDGGIMLYQSIPNGLDHVPLDTVRNDLDELISLFVEELATADTASAFYLMGGVVPSSTDQMNSLAPVRRTAAFAKNSWAPSVTSPGNPDLNKRFYQLILKDTDTEDNENFPGLHCHNHASNEAMGPLKTDWTISCPTLLEAKQADREAKCISQADSFWGAKNAARLESIKKNVDPNSLFICNAGIGSTSPLLEPNVETPTPSDGESVAPVVTTAAPIAVGDSDGSAIPSAPPVANPSASPDAESTSTPTSQARLTAFGWKSALASLLFSAIWLC